MGISCSADCHRMKFIPPIPFAPFSQPLIRFERAYTVCTGGKWARERSSLWIGTQCFHPRPYPPYPDPRLPAPRYSQWLRWCVDSPTMSRPGNQDGRRVSQITAEGLVGLVAMETHYFAYPSTHSHRLTRLKYISHENNLAGKYSSFIKEVKNNS